jgi:transcriptional regulator with XRE-family HTH domain
MKTKTKELLGKRIKELRKARHLSQEQLSEKIDIDPKHLSRIEVGKSYPSLDTLERIGKALHIDLQELFDFKHHMEDKEINANIINLLKQATKEQSMLILRLVKAVVY